MKGPGAFSLWPAPYHWTLLLSQSVLRSMATSSHFLVIFPATLGNRFYNPYFILEEPKLRESSFPKVSHLGNEWYH